MKCFKCGNEFKEVKKKTKLKISFLTEEDKEFIKESNLIEREPSLIAFEDACEAYLWAYDNINKPMNLDYVLKIHRILMKRLNPKIAGKIRNVPVYIGGEIRDQDKVKIEKELNSLIEFWNNEKFIHYASLGMEGYERKTKENFIKDWHVRFEKTHPFADGNGRTGRILMNIQRIKLGLPILVIHHGMEQNEYYKWFKG